MPQGRNHGAAALLTWEFFFAEMPEYWGCAPFRRDASAVPAPLLNWEIFSWTDP